MRGGGAGQYSCGASSALTKIVLYSSSVYTDFHSVIYNYVEFPQSYLKNLIKILQYLWLFVDDDCLSSGCKEAFS